MKKQMLWLCLPAIVLAGRIGWTQSPQDPAAITKQMRAEAQSLCDTLWSLNHLDAEQWRVHPGDLPHAESPALDDSSWAQAKVGAEYSEDSIWLRKWIEVPKMLSGYDLTGTRIWFQLTASANGTVPQIVYFNGRRVAMGEDLEPIVLFDQARPGDKVLVAVKLLNTMHPKRFRGSSLRIDFAEGRPSPDELREEILSTAEILPSLSKNMAADRAIYDKAIHQVDLKALAASDQQRFDTSLRNAQSTLDQFKPELRQVTFHLTGNSHIDAAWLWPWTETVDVVKRTFGTALQLMSEYPNYTYTQSAAAYNDWLAQKYPELDQQIKKRIQEGRWEIVGGMWVEPDLNLPDGEATARSLLIGKRWYQQHYGVDVRIGWNPDSFGYNWQLPQIYKKSGVDYFVTQKMSWNDTNQLPLKLFWWESPDGSKVLTYFPHGYGNRSLSPVRLSRDMAQARTLAPGLTEMMDLYGVGDHGGGPTRAMLDEGTRWLSPDKAVPHFEFGTAKAFFSGVEKRIASQSPEWDYRKIAEGYQPPAAPASGQVAIPTWKDELYLEYHRGVYTTQANHKRNMRESVEQALNAEKYASLAWLDGNSYPGNELTEAWKKITFNDFHDLAAGSGIGVIYKYAQKDYDEVAWATNEISAKALKTIAARVNTLPERAGHEKNRAAQDVPVFVFNPLGWQRSGLVNVDVQMPQDASDVSVVSASGTVLPSQIVSKDAKTHSFHLLIQAKDVPSLGYQVLHVVPGSQRFASDLHVNGTTLENDALRVTVDPKTGCITSLYDKKAHFESLAAGACGNELQAFKDTPKNYDAWNIDPGTLDQAPTRLTAADSVKVVESGPMRGVIRVSRSWQNSKFVQDIVLYAGSDQAVVVNDIDWHETHVLLKAAFPLAATSSFATYEIPYGTIQRPTTRNNSWEKARFEVPALRWADLGDGSHGFSLISDSKYGYDAVGNLLRLTLLRSPVSPDPDADRGHHHFSYALFPHAGDWRQAMTIRRGYDFNYQLHATPVEAHSGEMPAEHSFVSISPENVVLTAMKKAEDSNALVFHLFEWSGKNGNIELHVPPGSTGAVMTNLMEKPEGSPLTVKADTVQSPIHPYEIQTIRVDYPQQSHQ